jgi:hypothetical protein
MSTTLDSPGAGRITDRPFTLPFGRHAGQALATVPLSYLTWAMERAKLSSGLRSALEHELARRGVRVSPRPPRPLRPCPRHPDAGHSLAWQADRLARRRIRATCGACGRFLDFAPLVPCYVAKADQAARFEISRQREFLPFGHHAEVAGLKDEKEQDRLLDEPCGSWRPAERPGDLAGEPRGGRPRGQAGRP